ncbi:archaeosortase A [Methanosarcinales archaeon ex4572_44]|nr:MAG: archaeosortase A [Methanosarcinales archaeon ex4572_44]
MFILFSALGMLILSAIVPSRYWQKAAIAGIGWFIFSIHWFTKPFHYIEIDDYFNVITTILAGLLCVFFAIYFFFAEIPSFNQWLIRIVVDQTEWLLQSIDFQPLRVEWDVLSLNSHKVRIVLACTAIESIALFMGVTLACIDASKRRVALAFLASVPIIYLLNLVRNAFVIIASGFMWFGSPEESFYMAHNVIAKIGSTVALFAIAYVVLTILPELLEMIDGIAELLKKSLKRAGG